MFLSCRYFELKTTTENSEVKEEITYIIPDTESWASTSGTSERSDSGVRKECVETDQITSREREEKKRFVIRAVVDPRNGEPLSLADAIAAGIVDQEHGLYVNPDTKESASIVEAMNNDQIKVDYVSTKRSEEKVSAVGLITVKTMEDNRPYHIDQVIDGRTGEKVDPEEAKARGILDLENDLYVIGFNNEELTVDMAIDGGWILVEYEDESEPTWEVKTYAVSAVVDQRLKKKVPFYDAVRRGLIEKDTGNYVNNRTGERIYVMEAIKRGFLKAKLVTDTTGLDIDPENKVVVERMDMIKKSVLNPVAALNAFRKAAHAEAE